MLSIQAEFLTGRYVAADPYERDEPEWPPHPGRLFVAMAAAYFEGTRNHGERAALEWLEQCSPPSIFYDNKTSFPRETVHHFVPVNDRDKYLTPGQVQLGTIDLRGGRIRKERSFPTTVTGPCPVTFVWDAADAGPHVNALRAICARVHRLGHSSSIVHLTVGDAVQGADPALIPSERGGQKIRWISPGTLRQFEVAYEVEDTKNRQESSYFARKARLNAITLPSASYAPPRGGQGSVPSGQFAEMHVFEITKGPYPGLVHAREISRVVKSLMLAIAANTEPISGLDASGSPTIGPHISIVPLAFVGYHHADGGVRGLAIVMPRGLVGAPADAVLRSIRGISGNDDGGRDGTPGQFSVDVLGHGTVKLAPHAGDPTSTLDPSTWARRSRTWSTVTPIVLDRAPRERGDARDAEVSRIIARSCTLQGLPAPTSVYTSNVPYLPGPPLATAFPRYTVPKRPRPLERDAGGKRPASDKDATDAKVHTHAQITFGEVVCGPVVLGAGRYNGYGLCKPMRGSG